VNEAFRKFARDLGITNALAISVCFFSQVFRLIVWPEVTQDSWDYAVGTAKYLVVFNLGAIWGWAS